MNVRIHPKTLKGDLIVPPSKSLAHRAIIAAGLAKGRSQIKNVVLSDDIVSTIEAMRQIGAVITIDGSTLQIEGTKNVLPVDTIYAKESGSTLRFLIPIVLTAFQSVTFTGDNQLNFRPLGPYLDLFKARGIAYRHPEEASLPLTINGQLSCGIYRVRGDVSSQFITGLLYALPLLNGDSKIILTTELESKGYIDLTLDMLKRFQIRIDNHDYRELVVYGNQTYCPCDYTVEGDYSQAAFFLVANCLGASIRLKGLNLQSFQADRKILADLKEMNAKLVLKENEITVFQTETTGCCLDFSQSPDLGPALSVLACLSKGTSTFIHAERLRLKECDRIASMVEELKKMGADLTEQTDGMTIRGVKHLSGTTVDSHNDHRVAMALAIASLKTDGDLIIRHAECVAKSFPDFWSVFEQLGGRITYEEDIR